MFLVKTKQDNVINYWVNSIEDDFIQFLPDILMVEKEDLDIYYVDDKHIIKAQRSKDRFVTEVDLENKQYKLLKVIQGHLAGEQDPNDPDVILEQNTDDLLLEESVIIPIRKMISFPYDDQGNFLGNEQALE